MKSLSLLPLLALMSACASLNVEVSVLNPEIVRERAADDRLAKAMPSIMAQTDISVSGFFVERSNIHGKVYFMMRNALNDEAKKSTTKNPQELQETAKTLHLTEEQKSDYRFWEDRALLSVKRLQKEWPAYQAESDPAARVRRRNTIIATLDEFKSIQDEVDLQMAKDLDLATMQDRLKALPADIRDSVIKKIQKTIVSDIAAEKYQLFDPGNFQHSPFAYYVVKAPDKDWARDYDKSYGKGIFGNTDIAIKAIGPGNFTIKGVSFNPADVAVTAAKVTSQTVLLAAQIAGVPVKLSGTPNTDKPGAALAQSSQALGQSLALNERVDIRMIAHRDALRRVAAALVRERKVIASGSDAERRSALLSIKAVYDSQASRVRVSTD